MTISSILLSKYSFPKSKCDLKNFIIFCKKRSAIKCPKRRQRGVQTQSWRCPNKYVLSSGWASLRFILCRGRKIVKLISEFTTNIEPFKPSRKEPFSEFFFQLYFNHKNFSTTKTFHRQKLFNQTTPTERIPLISHSYWNYSDS